MEDERGTCEKLDTRIKLGRRISVAHTRNRTQDTTRVKFKVESCWRSGRLFLRMDGDGFHNQECGYHCGSHSF